MKSASKRALQDASSHVPPKRPTPAITAPTPFSIFVDEKFSGDNIHKENQPPSLKSTVSAPAAQVPTTQRQTALKPSSVVRQPAPQPALSLPLESENRKPEQASYQLQILSAHDGQEQTFEEYRAQPYLLKLQKQQQQLRSFGNQSKAPMVYATSLMAFKLLIFFSLFHSPPHPSLHRR